MKNLLLFFLLSISISGFSQDYIFWGDFLGNEIGRANTDGTNVTQVTVESTTRGLVADPTTETLYYVEGTGKQVKKVGFDGSNPETITTVSNPSQIELDLQNEHLYISDAGTNKIIRMDLDGSNQVDIITGIEGPSSLQLNLDEGKIYYMDRGTNTTSFYSSDLNGDPASRSLLHFTVTTVQTFDIDFEERVIYWTDRTNSEIRRAKLDGATVEETIAPANDQVASIRVDPVNKKLYWTEPDNNRIMTANLDGSDLEVFKDGIMGISNIALKIDRPIVETAPSSDLYWGDFISADLRKLNKDEKDIQIVIENQNTPRGVEIDLVKNKIFWIEATVDELKCADLGGGNIQTVASFTDASAIALDIDNEQAYVVDINEDVIKRVNYDGSDLVTVITSDNNIQDVFLHFGEKKIYWLDKTIDRSAIMKANFDGSVQEVVLESPDNLTRFDIDYINDYIFITNRTARAILRSNLDGSDLTFIASTFRLVGDIIVDSKNEKIYWAESTKNRIRTADLDGSNVKTVVNEIAGITGIALGIRNASSSAKNIVKEFFEILPNPASDFLYFENEKPGKISVFSTDGKIQLSQRSEIGQNSINIQNLTPGTYFLILEENGKSKFSKFVKTE